MHKDQRERLRRRRRERAERAQYETGYGKPPAETRFSSTNQPKKARKHRKSRDERVAAIADEMVSVQINGMPCKISRHEAIVRKVGIDAASGKMTAIVLWFKYVSSKETSTPQGHSNIDYGAEVLRKIDAMADRIQKRKAAEAAQSGSGPTSVANVIDEASRREARRMSSKTASVPKPAFLTSCI